MTDYETIQNALINIDRAFENYNIVFQSKMKLAVEPSPESHKAGSNYRMGLYVKSKGRTAMDVVSWDNHLISDNSNVHKVFYFDGSKISFWSGWNNTGSVQCNTIDPMLLSIYTINYLYTWWGFPWSEVLSPTNVSHIHYQDVNNDKELIFDLAPEKAPNKRYHITLSASHDYFPIDIQVFYYDGASRQETLRREYKTLEFMQLPAEQSIGSIHWFPQKGTLWSSLIDDATNRPRPPVEVTIVRAYLNPDAIDEPQFFGWPRGCPVIDLDSHTAKQEKGCCQVSLPCSTLISLAGTESRHVHVEDLSSSEIPSYCSQYGNGFTLADMTQWVNSQKE